MQHWPRDSRTSGALGTCAAVEAWKHHSRSDAVEMNDMLAYPGTQMLNGMCAWRPAGVLAGCHVDISPKDVQAEESSFGEAGLVEHPRLPLDRKIPIDRHKRYAKCSVN